jgi:putative hydrolase of HD superfamily
MASRLEQQIAFILEVDKRKGVLRKARVLDSRRFENSAEHTWHIALMAMILHEHASEPVDLLRTLKMLLVHDIVEIDAGDTFAYGDQSHKAGSEAAAAQRIFGLLPADQFAECLALWLEFEARVTPEARFANAVDRLMPALHNLHGEGGTWREHSVSWDQVERRLSPIGLGGPALWEWLQPRLEAARLRGDIL